MNKNIFRETTLSDDSLDQTTFDLDEEQTSAFVTALSNPPAPAQALRELMARRSPWEDEGRNRPV